MKQIGEERGSDDFMRVIRNFDDVKAVLNIAKRVNSVDNSDLNNTVLLRAAGYDSLMRDDIHLSNLLRYCEACGIDLIMQKSADLHKVEEEGDIVRVFWGVFPSHTAIFDKNDMINTINVEFHDELSHKTHKMLYKQLCKSLSLYFYLTEFLKRRIMRVSKILIYSENHERLKYPS